jgi:hypothetical protein
VWQEEERLGMNPYREIYKGNLHVLNIGHLTDYASGIFIQSEVVILNYGMNVFFFSEFLASLHQGLLNGPESRTMPGNC